MILSLPAEQVPQRQHRVLQGERASHIKPWGGDGLPVSADAHLVEAVSTRLLGKKRGTLDSKRAAKLSLHSLLLPWDLASHVMGHNKY